MALPLHGINGDVTFGAGHVVRVKNWTIDVEIDNAQTGDFSDTWKETVTGLKFWSGSYTVNVDDTTKPEIGDFAGNNGEASFQITTGYDLNGCIVITGGGLAANVDEGPQEFSFTFAGNGELAVDDSASCPE